MSTSGDMLKRVGTTRDESRFEITVVEAAVATSAAKRRTIERLLAWASPILFLLLWEVAAQMGLVDERFFPAPSAILQATWTALQDGSLWDNTWASSRRLVIGFLVGALPGLFLGLVLGFSRFVRAAILPLANLVYPIPKSAIAPLLVLTLGFGEASKWALVALGVFFPVFFNTLAGVLNLDKIYREVAHNFGASRLQFLRTVALPGAMPMIMTGLRLGFGMGLLLIAVAEMIGAHSGLGFMIYQAWELFEVSQMYTGLFAIAIIGLIVQVSLTALERRLVPWSED